MGGGHLSGKYLGGKKPAGSREVLWGNRFDRYRTQNTEPAVKAYYVEWHLKQSLAPLLFEDEEIDDSSLNVIKASRSESARTSHS